MKVLIAGSGPGSGKTWLANRLALELGLSVAETSTPIVLELLRRLNNGLAVHSYDGRGLTRTAAYAILPLHPRLTPEDIEAKKEYWRPFLVSLGDELTERDPLALWKMSDSPDVLCGVRRKAEFRALTEEFPDVLTVFVDHPNPNRQPDNSEIPASWCFATGLEVLEALPAPSFEVFVENLQGRKEAGRGR